jgi:magnesium chelatase subunit D
MNARASSPTIKPARRSTGRPVYPFAAIVGQEEMKLALLLNAIDASIGGVLIMGHRGTGKSTAVRALAALLPEIWRVSDCLYGCDPADERELCADCEARLAREGKLARERARVTVVDLPLGATEDRVCGTINIERAIVEGVRAFDAGLLARAHRGFLYIDEVNLLEDHLIDLLLDVAVTGHNQVEREGISIEHPSRFVLVGSGNPEEGELRPQLQDRFGLQAEVVTAASLDERVRIVELREAFDRDPAAFCAGFEKEQESLRRRITRARRNLPAIVITRALLRQIAQLCSELNVDGHRGELTITRAARALAAFEGRKEVTIADVRRVATLALRHRLRRDPFEPTESGARVHQQLAELFPETADETRRAGASQNEDEDVPPQTPGDGASRRRESSATGQPEQSPPATGPERDEQRIFPTLDAAMPENNPPETPQRSGRGDSKRTSARRRKGLSRTAANPLRGRYVRAVARKASGARLAIDATLRAASQRAWGVGGGIAIADLRFKSFRRKSGALFIFAVDTSGSMALNRIGQAKGAMARLLERAYVKRDRVALVSFRQERAELLLPPSQSATRARRILNALPVGGSTPLAAGIQCALEVAERAGRQQQSERIKLLLFTDGRSNVPLRGRVRGGREARQILIGAELEQLGGALERARVEAIVVDTQAGFTSRGEGEALAHRLRAAYVHLPPNAAFSVKGEALLESKRVAGF